MVVLSWWSWCAQLGQAFALVVGTIGAGGDRAYAQSKITPDATLGGERSVVTPNVTIKGLPSDKIDGGATRGSNLFHSFSEFNVGGARGVYFTNPAGIVNIFSRVTGNIRSEILGTLGVTGGNANLFFINPNGIIFGPNARLDVGGSFLASTANAIQFGNQGKFSASNPDAPPLLTINPDALLYLNQIPGTSIQNNSVALDLSATSAGLHVPDGQSLLLVGGNIIMDGGILNASGGRVELGGLAGSGTVGLNVNGNNLSLSFPDAVVRADVSLNNGAAVDVKAGGGGSIAVNARNIDVLGGSNLSAGIRSGLGAVGSQAGDITLNATGATQVVKSYINNNFGSRATGKSGGNINITTGSLYVKNFAQLNASTDGTGDAGAVTINAQDTVSFDSAYTFNIVATGAVGNSGGININTGSLFLANGAQLQTLVAGSDNQLPAGRGNAGDINIGFQINPPQDTPLSDITASSEVGPQGIVTINTPEVNPASGLFVLPVQVVDASRQIVASGCPAGDGITGNQFIVTGRGGLPPSPDDILSGDVVWSDTRLQGFTASGHPQQRVSAKPRSHPAAVAIVPATGWVFNNKGEVTLIASPNATPESFGSNGVSCHVSSK